MDNGSSVLTITDEGRRTDRRALQQRRWDRMLQSERYLRTLRAQLRQPRYGEKHNDSLRS